MIFIIFDIEIVFIYPWAVIYRQLDTFGLAEMVVFAIAATIMGGIGNIAGAAITAVILGIIQNASILVISSEWQGFLLYLFLFLAIVFFPNGLRLPRRHVRFGTATRELAPSPDTPAAESKA